MSAIDIPVREDEALWRSPTGAREWLRAGCWVWSARSMFLVALVIGIFIGGLVLVASLAFIVLWGNDIAVASISVLLVTVMIGAPAALLTGFGCLMVPQLTITRDEIRLVRYAPWRREKAVAKSEIRSAIIHEGDGAVTLLGDAGVLLFAHHMAKSSDFIEKLNVPAIAWFRHKSSKVAEFLFVLSALVWSVLAMLAAMLISLSAQQLYEFAIGPVPWANLPGWGVAFIYVAGMIIATPLTLILALIVGRLFISSSSQAEFILFLRDNDRWHGHTPKRWGLVGRFVSSCIRLAIRIARIPPPPPLKPELRHGMTTEMAAAIEGVA